MDGWMDGMNENAFSITRIIDSPLHQTYHFICSLVFFSFPFSSGGCG